MARSIERRIADLERIFGPPEVDRHRPERERLIAELRRLEEKQGELWERARREAEEGHPQRLRALEDLEETYRRRVEDCGA